MANKLVISVSLAALVLFTSVLAFGACGGGAEPEARDFDLQIEDKKLNFDPSVIKVKQGDTVTLRIDADESGTFHLHGYDIQKEVGPDGTTTMELTASATGRFNITFHPGGGGEEEHAESEEAQAEGDEHAEGEGEEIMIASFEVHPR